MLSMDRHPLLLWKRGILRGVRTAKREKRWMGAFGVLLSVTLLLQLLFLGLLGLRSIQTLLETHTELRLIIQHDASDQSIQEFYASIQQLPYTKKALYITREQAYEYARNKDPELIASLEKFGLANPFPDTIGVLLTSLNHYHTFSAFLEQPQWAGILDPAFLSEIQKQETQILELLQITNTGKTLGILALLLGGGILILSIIEIVRRRLSDRSEEVLVERIVGAHPLTIFLPFVVEASILLWISLAVSVLCLVLLSFLLPLTLPSAGESTLIASVVEEFTLQMKQTFPLLLCLEVLLVPVIASIGAALSMWQKLRPLTLTLRAHAYGT